MSDAVSREVVLDALRWDDLGRKQERVLDIIDALPSVEPDEALRAEVVREHERGNVHYESVLALRAEVESLRSALLMTSCHCGIEFVCVRCAALAPGASRE